VNLFDARIVRIPTAYTLGPRDVLDAHLLAADLCSHLHTGDHKNQQTKKDKCTSIISFMETISSLPILSGLP
jgi:L-rhamnose isomerase